MLNYEFISEYYLFLYNEEIKLVKFTKVRKKCCKFKSV